MTKKTYTEAERTVQNIHTIPFKPYDMEGPVVDGMTYSPLTFNKMDNNKGFYVIRMEPGSVTTPHTHNFNEDYYIIEGELIEPDGKVLVAGDFIHYEAGSNHNSRTETGCLLIGCDWD